MSKNRSEIKFSIIAGELKNRVVMVPDTGGTRPPLTRLRRAIFDYLTPYLPGARYLDLFSGTGSYMFEAISRGASAVDGVEIDLSLAEAISLHAGKLGVADKLHCHNLDVYEAIPAFGERNETFDLIMIAPPQYKGLIDRTLSALRTNRITAEQNQIICQHDSAEKVLCDPDAFDLLQQRKYGNTTFSIYSQR